MKLRMFQHILTLAALLCVLLCTAPSASAAVSTEDMQQMLQKLPLKSYEYEYSTDSGSVSASVYYSHALLLQDSTTISPDLVKSSLALSVSAYDREKVTPLLKKMGFTPEDNTAVYDRSESGLTVTDCDYAAYTIATAEVKHPLEPDGQNDYIIYCVAIQGTPLNLEWLSDFNLGDGVYHEGFRKASEEIYYAVRDMCKSDNYPSGRTILWLTGHSRGAACANLLASWFQEREDYDVPVVKENVIAYTFGCPAVSKKADPTMPGIYNFNNPGDLVSMVPLAEWGYGRYGQTIELDTSAMGYGNFTTRYAAVTGKTYAGAIDDRDFRAVLSEIGKSENTQLILDLVAWILDGCNRDVLNEIILKNMPDDPQGFLSILEKAVPEAGYAVKVFDLVEFLYTQNEQNAGLISWANTNYDKYLNATPEEFALFLQNNASTIVRLEDITGIVITEPQDLRSAKIRLETDSNNTLRLQSFIGSAADLICDGEGNIASKVMHAHNRTSYTLWINSMFYGHQGWKDNPLISQISLDERYFSVGDSCFQNCSALTDITIPSTVTHIGDYAFAECSALTDITIPDTVTHIGDYAFADCEIATSELTFSDSLTSIGNGSFRNWDALTKILIPDTVEYVGTAAFGYCDKLTDVTLPCDTGSKAFQGVTTLERIRYTKGKTGVMPSHGRWSSYFDYDYWGPANESSETLKEIIFDEGITHIAAFLGRSENGHLLSLTSVTLPSTLQSVGESAFEGCANAKFNDWPKSLTTIGKLSFGYCDQLTAIPATLTYFPASCFIDCSGLTEITIPDAATGAGDNAFSYCDNVRSLTMPADFPHYGVFYPMSSLETIHYTKGKTGIMCDRKEDASYYVVAGPEYGTNGSLKQIIFDEGVTYIAAYLTGPKAELGRRSSITSVIFPSSLEAIGTYAFAGCSNIESLSFSGSAPDIADDAFYGVRTTVYYPANGTTWTENILRGYGGTLTWQPLACSGAHIEEILQSVAPTCGKPGMTDGTHCTLCGVILKPQAEIPATGKHTEEAVSGFAPTCNEPGMTDGTRCTVCEQIVKPQEEIPATGKHTEEAVSGFAPTCTEPGMTDGTRCTVCEQTVKPQEEIPAAGHKEESFGNGSKPGCTYPGLTDTLYCSVCDRIISYGETIPPTGHTEVPAEGSYPPTCVSPGLNAGTRCAVCAVPIQPEEEIPATGKHTEAILEGLPPTCMTTGYTDGSYCSVCGTTLKTQEFLDTSDHTEVVIEGYPSTCTTTGLTDGSYCSVCETTIQFQEMIPASDKYHDLDVNFVWNTARYTCTADFSCQNCQKQETVFCEVTAKVLPAAGSKPSQIVFTATAIALGSTHTNTKVVDLLDTDQGKHTPSSQWFSNGDQHWKQCLTCVEKLGLADHTPGTETTQNTSPCCTVCRYVLRTPLGLDWFFDRLETPDNYLWASGTYVKIMERYGDRYFSSQQD